LLKADKLLTFKFLHNNVLLYAT